MASIINLYVKIMDRWRDGLNFLAKLFQAKFQKQKRSFRRHGLTSNDCLPYEKT